MKEPAAQAPPRTSVGNRHGAGGAWLLFVVPLFHLAVLGRHNGTATLFATLYLLLVPGTLLLKALGLEPSGAARRLVLTVGASLSGLYAVILLVQVLAPAAGETRPLSTWPMVLGVDALTALLAGVAVLRGNPLTPTLPQRVRGFWALALLPVATAASVEVLQAGGSALGILACLVAAGAVLLWVLLRSRTDGPQDGVALAVYCVALTLLWSFSLRSAGLYGYDIQQEYATFTQTSDALRWSPLDGDSYMAMLSINALPTLLTQVTGLSGLTVFKLVVPMLFALYPVAILEFARRWLSPLAAVTATGLVFLSGSFASQMPALARQEIGLLLFAGLLLAAFGPQGPGPAHRRGSQVLVVVLGAGLVVSHYSTAYVALAAMVLGQVLLAVLRLMRGERLGGQVLTLPVVALLVAVCATWTLGITQSTRNILIFAQDVSEDGAQVLPNQGGSLAERWLSGNLTRAVEPRVYFDEAAAVYAQKYPWLLSYPESAQQRFPAVASSAPGAEALLPALSGPRYLATLLIRQGTNLAIGVGCLLAAWLALRRRLDPHLVALLLGVFAITVMIRLSGSASSQYNPERLALQTGALLVVPLGLAGSRLWHRVRSLLARIPLRPGRVVPGLVAAGLLTVVFLDASALGSRLEGGSPGNLSRSGEYAERFTTTDQDIAAAQWLRAHRFQGSTVFADRYGSLIVQANEYADHTGVFGDLTPGTIDARGFVFATTSNIVDGRARGTTPDSTMSSTYEFPATFLNIYKPLVFDTGWARVYS
ncbi:DUF2206 domain-containing protein [Kineosporia sp. J2-2]|uniref:DUF2206 domain-containing protein n=1 Tax=Kineosporia corallincola TaxID=2835133 RepID=A0ABS5TMH2_9ACTN|nr:DUF2206 domain-containing protein [Kineosporia corallincola]MBT0772043.1 DUF2206 domain-containing protein [Kineosporia corallincola]